MVVVLEGVLSMFPSDRKQLVGIGHDLCRPNQS